MKEMWNNNKPLPYYASAVFNEVEYWWNHTGFVVISRGEDARRIFA